LHTVYASGLYNFIYAVGVYDVNSYANAYLTSAYNFYWLPTCYYDGGYRQNDGQTPSGIAPRLLACGAREVPDLDLSITVTWLGSASIQVDVSITNHEYVNTAPLTPQIPVGPGWGTATFTYAYTDAATDPDGDPLYYMFDWGDQTMSDWLGPFPAGENGTGSHAWATNGIFEIKAKVKDTLGAESAWTPATTITLAKPADANGDGKINSGDAVYIISYIFRGGAAPPYPNAADANCDNKLNSGDAVYIISYIFRSGPEPGCH
jgi:hypothetical protein